ncbi:MAG: molybdenum cofactor biosynthesis protein B [Pseudomonadota bacterium]|nr:molybdenum cofactor biosynthesis protein B [Gammaproteobacteria bacterium]MEE2684011.1 molybdenum cofactor biosynthesis protein B [Pseudomonadota bacterium]
MTKKDKKAFVPLSISLLTISDTRNIDNDTSGDLLVSLIKESGHNLFDRKIVKDNIFEIRSIVSRWIASETINVVITTGGTGITGKDGTPEAIEVLLDKKIDGFGEFFRYLSFNDIGTSSLQSRAIAGVANSTFIFSLPGSTNACKTAWEKIISFQLDSRTSPCNLAELIPRLEE